MECITACKAISIARNGLGLYKKSSRKKLVALVNQLFIKELSKEEDWVWQAMGGFGYINNYKIFWCQIMFLSP